MILLDSIEIMTDVFRDNDLKILGTSLKNEITV